MGVMMKRDVVDYFVHLAGIDSESKNERAIADALVADLKAMGAQVEEDDVNSITGGNAGNIFATFKGDLNKKPILFCAHIDTVKPGIGVKPQIKGDRIVSDGTTVLGADDKSGVAEIICGIQSILDLGIPHAPIEVLFTISEEIGLMGAKHFDKSKLKSALGYALDTQEIGEIVVGAPSQNSIFITIKGKEAHAGVEPEKGINAIRVASEALAAMPIGRIDFETTTNMGVISGGTATNIVPNKVEIKGEARSHNPAKLEQACKDIVAAVEHAVGRYETQHGAAACEVKIHKEYDSFCVAEDQLPVSLAKKAMDLLQIDAKVQKGGGGSDANIINAGGVPTVILGTGMHAYHTVNEYIETADLHKGVSIVAQLIKLYSQD